MGCLLLCFPPFLGGGVGEKEKKHKKVVTMLLPMNLPMATACNAATHANIKECLESVMFVVSP